MLAMPLNDIQFPEKFEGLFDPHRYKVFYGGRGAAKSWSIARALVLKAVQGRTRILCAREIQKSMSESVHQLLKDVIREMGFDYFFNIKNDSIEGMNGSLFMFAGLRHNIDNIKSKEGIDIVWVEEANTVSASSWKTLIPTIRKEGSEIWISFNPELDSDETYIRFVKNPPSNSIVVKVNWSDNPWFPQVLHDEMTHLRETNYDEYLNVWEGFCKQTLDGAIYAEEVRKATTEGRILKIPYDPQFPVYTFWDLGWADHTSILCVQAIGYEFRIIDHISNRQKPLAYYLKELQGKPYLYADDWLPHDARAKSLGTGKSVEELMREAGRKVRITPSLSIEDGINAARTIFPKVFINESCETLLQSLRRYRYDVDDKTGQVSRRPLHDENSHDCDAFRYMAVALKEPLKSKNTGLKHMKRSVV